MELIAFELFDLGVSQFRNVVNWLDWVQAILVNIFDL